MLGGSTPTAALPLLAAQSHNVKGQVLPRTQQP